MEINKIDGKADITGGCRISGSSGRGITAKVLKGIGLSPYIYLGFACDLLSAGYNEAALEVLSYTESLFGNKIPVRPEYDNDCRESIELLRLIVKKYPDEFRYLLNNYQSSNSYK